MIEAVGSVIGDVDIGEPIVVVIAGGHSHAVIRFACEGESGFRGDVGERPIAILTVEPVPVGGLTPVEPPWELDRIFEGAAVDEEDIEQPVIVVVEERHSAAHGFDEVLLRGRRIAMNKGQPLGNLRIEGDKAAGRQQAQTGHQA